MSPLIPIRCSNCGRASTGQGGILIENSTDVTIKNSTMTCPHCGADAQVLEGRFSVVDGAIEMLSGPRWSFDLVEELRLALRRVVNEKPDDPIASIEQVSSPLGAAIRRLTTNWSKSDVIALIMLILYVLDRGQTVERPEPAQPPVTIYINESGQTCSAEQRIAEILSQVEKNGLPEPGRNDPCFCGSDIKYKKCHGRHESAQ